MCCDPYTAGQLVGRWHGSTSFHIQIPLKLNILFYFIPGYRDSGPFFSPAEIADDGLASYHTSVKEEVHGRAFATKIPLFADKKNI